MLVLSRKLHEKIIINGNIVIEIVDRKGTNFKIGVTAPADVPIFREELQDKIDKEKRSDT